MANALYIRGLNQPAKILANNYFIVSFTKIVKKLPRQERQLEDFEGFVLFSNNAQGVRVKIVCMHSKGRQEIILEISSLVLLKW